MGGNIFKDYLSSKNTDHVLHRLDTEDYNSGLMAVTSLLRSLGYQYKTIDFVREKDSHGDIDIIVIKDPSRPIGYIKEYLEDHKVKVDKSGDNLSFLMFTFQVDLIFVSADEADYSQSYYSWNDLGNLIGRTSKQLNLKHGNSGLYYIQRTSDTHVLAEHKLSSDPLTVLSILELDVEHFKRGFDTYVEMFEWISKSPYFNYNMFKFENLNNRNRVRDKKRRVYNLFIEWCSKQTFDDPVIIDDTETFVCNTFEGLRENLDLVLQQEIHKKLVREKFNGNIVSNITNLFGKNLGRFMGEFRSKYSDEFLLEASEETIHKLISEQKIIDNS